MRQFLIMQQLTRSSQSIIIHAPLFRIGPPDGYSKIGTTEIELFLVNPLRSWVQFLGVTSGYDTTLHILCTYVRVKFPPYNDLNEVADWWGAVRCQLRVLG
jgi:hypothetical protein